MIVCTFEVRIQCFCNGFVAEYRRVCVYTNWAQYRSGQGQFTPEKIDTTLCTHGIYAFASMSGNRIIPYEWNDDDTDWQVGM